MYLPSFGGRICCHTGLVRRTDMRAKVSVIGLFSLCSGGHSTWTELLRQCRPPLCFWSSHSGTKHVQRQSPGGLVVHLRTRGCAGYPVYHHHKLGAQRSRLWLRCCLRLLTWLGSFTWLHTEPLPNVWALHLYLLSSTTGKCSLTSSTSSTMNVQGSLE